MSEIKLKPCPFCGRAATSSEKEGIGNMPSGWGWVGCRCCRVFINYSHGERGEKLAVEAWNNRKPMEQIVEKLEDEAELSYADFKGYAEEHDMDAEYDDDFRYGMRRAIEIVRESGE